MAVLNECLACGLKTGTDDPLSLFAGVFKCPRCGHEPTTEEEIQAGRSSMEESE